MEEVKLKISGTCHFVKTTYGDGFKPDVYLEYTEHSTDHWHGDTEISIDIGRELAIKIVNFLTKVHSI